jgi:hypothetical protein
MFVKPEYKNGWKASKLKSYENKPKIKKTKGKRPVNIHNKIKTNMFCLNTRKNILLLLKNNKKT